MQKLFVAMLAALAILAGCGKPKNTLHLYTWSEYIDPDLVAEFAKQNDCRVVIDIFNANEAMLAKIQAGSTGYDIIVPSSYMVKIMAQKGLLEPIDKTRIPTLPNIDPAYAATALDPQMTYGVPYMVTFTGIAYNKEVVGAIDPTWSVFETRADLKGRITLLDDMRETIGAALKYKGYSCNTTNEAELAEARDVVVAWKANIAKFENEQYKNGIANGEFQLVHGYHGDIGQVQLDDDNIGFLLPQEGFLVSCDEMVIPKDAKNKELAYRFIAFLHEGEVAARNMIYTTYWCPNTAAVEFMEESEKASIIPAPEDFTRGEVIDDLGEALKLYSKTWDEIKAAR
ncbi:MAG: polyamine ABC transporter substrate-binding protein [Kiritimatiellia bacterium]|jgi:spermidine/putrescine transport system substrate-binding protein